MCCGYKNHFDSGFTKVIFLLMPGPFSYVYIDNFNKLEIHFHLTYADHFADISLFAIQI